VPVPLLAIGMLALPLLSDAGKKVQGNDAMLLVGALGALWLWSKVQGPLGVIGDAREAIEDAIELGEEVAEQVNIIPEVGEFIQGSFMGRPKPTGYIPGSYVPNQMERGLSPNPPAQWWVEKYKAILDEDPFADVPPMPVKIGWEPPTAFVAAGYPEPPTPTTAQSLGYWWNERVARPQEIDLPGLAPYDLRNIPGDIVAGFKKLRVL
jgi:hypothetical protein